MTTSTQSSAKPMVEKQSNIQVYNTLTRTKEPFQPVQPGKVGMYLCGPTVYKEAHIGHMVGPVIFDCVKRYLAYCGYDVTWVVNITDVDDKLIAEANRRGIPMADVATEMTPTTCRTWQRWVSTKSTKCPRQPNTFRRSSTLSAS